MGASDDTDEITLAEDVELAQDANWQAAQTILNSVARESIRYVVHRQTGESGNDVEFVMKCPASDFPTLDDLRAYVSQKYNGGKYRLYLYVDDILRKNIAFMIALQPVKTEEEHADITGLMRFMAEQNRAIIAEMRASAQRQTGPDPITQAVSLMGAMSAMTKNLIATSRGETSGGDPLEYVSRIMDISERLNARRGDDEDKPVEHWLPGLLEKAVPPLLALAAQRTGTPAPILPAAPAVTPTETLPALESADMNLKLLPKLMLQPYVNKYIGESAGLVNLLNSRAQLDSDPDIYAEVILDLLPESVADAQIEQVLTREDILDIFFTANPAGSGYRDWYVRLKDALLTALRESAANDTTHGGASDTH